MKININYITLFFLSFLLFITESFAMPIKIGTGDKNLYFYNLGLSICKEISNEKSIPCQVIPTKGSVENLFLLKNKEIDIALVQSDVFWMSQNGETPFGANDGFSFNDPVEVGKLQLFILTNQNNIRSFADLAGKRVNFGPVNSGLRTTFLYLAKQLNIDLKNTKITEQSAALQAATLCKNELDVITFILPSNSAVIAETLKKCPMHFVSFSETEMNNISKLPIGYQKILIPENTYSAQNNTINTLEINLLKIENLNKDSNEDNEDENND